MTTLDKHAIVNELRAYCNRFSSQNKAANSLKNVSPGTISQMLNGKWDNISEAMWRGVLSQIGGKKLNTWSVVETRGFKEFTQLLDDARLYSNVIAVIGSAGSGKSETSKRYAADNKNTYRLVCSEFWNRKTFLGELLAAMGRDHGGMTVYEMMATVVRELKKQDDPLLILDEADKLIDQVLYFFITLYNELEDHLGIVLCATEHLRKRIDRGINLNKKGYNEIYSRFGRKFIELTGINHADVFQVCMANGIEDRETIMKIWDDCEGDLRRVNRKVHATKQKENAEDQESRNG